MSSDSNTIMQQVNTIEERLMAQYSAEAADPVWREGFADGRAPGALTTPDMRRGRAYALGYITGRWVSWPVSMSTH